MKNINPKKIFSLTAVVSLGLVATGCNTTTQAGPMPLRIGLAIDDNNPNASASNEDFRLALEDFLQIPVVVMEDVSYLIGIEAMRSGNLDVMMASAFNYVMAQDVLDVTLLAGLQLSQGGNNTSFITRSDNPGIHSLADFAGSRFAFVDAASTSGALFPKYELVSQFGLDPELIMHSGHFFDTAVYSGSHNASIMGVYFGDFDGAAVATLMIDGLVNAGSITPGSIRVVAETADFPNPAYIARTALGEDLIGQLQDFFLNFDDSDFFYHAWGDAQLRFSEPDRAGFDGVLSLMQTLGLDFGG